jgi:hypothetical protein
MVLWFASEINYYQLPMEASVQHQAPHEALCVEIREGAGERGHAHVTAVMTRDGGGPARRWSIVQLVEAMRAGERFGVGESSGAATLRPAVCGRCPMLTIVSDPPDALARLPACGDA